jgi:hypothetical protein
VHTPTTGCPAHPRVHDIQRSRRSMSAPTHVPIPVTARLGQGLIDVRLPGVRVSVGPVW